MISELCLDLVTASDSLAPLLVFPVCLHAFPLKERQGAPTTCVGSLESPTAACPAIAGFGVRWTADRVRFFHCVTRQRMKSLSARVPKTMSAARGRNCEIISGNSVSFSDHSLSRNCGSRGPLDHRPGSLLSLRTPAVVADPAGGRLISPAEGGDSPS